MDVLVDGERLTIGKGATVLDACDAAGRYVPRLCYHPGVVGREAVSARGDQGWDDSLCGLCVVRLGDGSTVLACVTAASPGMEIVTEDPELQATRRQRLASILARHPHICLSCPDRDGCARDECTYGIPLEARCCQEFGHCELGRLVDFVDRDCVLPRTAVATVREASIEGRIRREPGLCIACGRCVCICSSAPEAGAALQMVAEPGEEAQGRAGDANMVALPRNSDLRASGCTFCGLCVMVCPTGAVTASAVAGDRWLTARREKSGLKSPVYPPEIREAFTVQRIEAVPRAPGVFRLFDGSEEVIRISGVEDLRGGLTQALGDPACAAGRSFQVELDQMYTQRESELLAQYTRERGHLPAGNDLADDLFDDEDD
ncbi:MAG: (2Fe-2S)-binding protein [Thermoleophilia bacterium]|nr:(2Fe-2S)-binding protein [Thermoleophilia bacterium]